MSAWQPWLASPLSDKKRRRESVGRTVELRVSSDGLQSKSSLATLLCLFIMPLMPLDPYNYISLFFLESLKNHATKEMLDV